jgi:hypothetical protein
MTADNANRVSTTTEPDTVTLLEALASEVVPTGVNMSNASTPTAAEADDQ